MTIRELTFDEVDLVSGGQDDEEEVDEIIVVGTRGTNTYYYNVSGGYMFGEGTITGGGMQDRGGSFVGVIGRGMREVPVWTSRDVQTLPPGISPRVLRQIRRLGNTHER